MDIDVLKGIGAKKKDQLARLNIYSVADLYNYYPKAYEDRSKLTRLAEGRDNKKHFFIWTIRSKLYTKNLRKMTLSYLYASEEGSNERIRLVWLYDRYSPRKLKVNKTYKFFTKIKEYRGEIEAINPDFSEMDEDQIGSIVSIYGLTSGLSNKQVHTFINEALEYFDSKEDFVNKEIAQKFDLGSRLSNLKEVHNPTNISKLTRAKSNIKVLDLCKDLVFLDQIKKKTKHPHELKLEYDIDAILGKLDFDLTKSQLRSLKEILRDCISSYNANRLLIGDVGSGKTIVALIVMIIFAMNSYQAAMMVPTEVLAIQHYEKNLDFFNKFGVRAALLTGSTKDKESIKEDLAEGKIDILIGTHAIIQEDVSFNNLKFVVNDEQHRFGVSQRQMLALKGEDVNYLTMTATPIPRTLYLKISNILDMSVIDEVPKGRKPIETKIVGPGSQDILFGFIEKNIKNKRQVYVVTNNIDSDDKNSLINLYKVYKEAFKAFRVGILHGKLKSSEKDQVLKDFAMGKIDILVATTVIEVGIDVANANIMLIYNPNNFGLSTLHQLRGRVGRGNYESYCFLVNEKDRPDVKLKVLEENTDGFEISKKDFEMRGGGKILSLLQHGKNLSDVEYLNMDQAEIDKSFEIFSNLRENDYKDCDLSFIKEFFKEDKRIILN